MAQENKLNCLRVRQSLKINDVMKEKWDYLIILDACRYDYFASLYKEFFHGELEKRISTGSSTPEWCLRQFKGYYPDVIYISGNPFINSKVEMRGFDAKKHFYEVIDVWDFGWSEELGTVPPENINRTVLDLISRFPRKRLIIHYLQPHVPYISPKFKTSVKAPVITDWRNRALLTTAKTNRLNRYLNASVNTLGNLLVRAKLLGCVDEIRELLGLPPATHNDAVRRKYGISGLREAYRENLRIALAHAANLCDRLISYRPSSQIVITSDHGELLGENGKFGHRAKSKDPYLLEIPWLRVKSVKRKVSDEETRLPIRFTKLAAESYKKKLKEKIKRLKIRKKLMIHMPTKLLE